MAYVLKQWNERHGDRIDISVALTHLTKETKLDGRDLSAVEVLLRILDAKTIVGSTTTTGFIVGTRAAVCFQDAPLLGLAQNIRFEQKQALAGGKVRYRGVGIAFHKRYAFAQGARPVIYEDTDVAKAFLPESELWRVVRLNLSDSENIVDWTHEREWRAPGDFRFELKYAAIVVANTKDYRELIDRAAPSILKEVLGVTVLAHATS